MKALKPAAPLFANLLEPPSVLDDIAVAALLVLGAAPAALFVLLVASAPTPPACIEAGGVPHAETGRSQAPSSSSMI